MRLLRSLAIALVAMLVPLGLVHPIATAAPGDDTISIEEPTDGDFIWRHELVPGSAASDTLVFSHTGPTRARVGIRLEPVDADPVLDDVILTLSSGGTAATRTLGAALAEQEPVWLGLAAPGEDVTVTLDARLAAGAGNETKNAVTVFRVRLVLQGEPAGDAPGDGGGGQPEPPGAGDGAPGEGHGDGADDVTDDGPGSELPVTGAPLTLLLIGALAALAAGVLLRLRRHHRSVPGPTA